MNVKYGPLKKAILMNRENRFIANVKMNNEIIRCHLPNPGRMTEFFLPGSIVYIQTNNDPKRKTKATIYAIQANSELVQLHTLTANRLIPYLIKDINQFAGVSILKSEYTVGKHRFDYLLKEQSHKIIAEVKSTTKVVDGVACFPDAVSERASQHLESLITLSKKYRTMIIFMVFCKAKVFDVCHDIDPKFSKIYKKAISSGVEVIVIQCASELSLSNDEYYVSTSVSHVLPIIY